MSSNGKNSPRIVTAEMLTHLPETVQRYFNYTGVVGKPWIDTVRIKYRGRFRTGADKPWMPITAKQYYRTNPPAFLWDARLWMFGLPLMAGHDTYKDGHGHMFGKVAGLFTIFDSRGPEMDQGTMMRYLNEMTWFPIALLSDYITWEAIDERSVKVIYSKFGMSVSATLFIDEQGRLYDFVTQRYRENKGSFSFDTWTTPMDKWGSLGGLNLPLHGYAVWKLPDGDLPYADLTLTEIIYNEPIPAF